MKRPSFFIVGAPRSGTTALYKYLSQHPQIFMPYRKEPVYFGADLPGRYPLLDERKYLKLFAPARQRICGEASVWYLYSETAAREIKAFNPEARIIIILRDPVEMLYSLHALMYSNTREDIASFGDALAAEVDRQAGRRMPPNVWWPRALQYHWLGDYAPHVARYFEVFGRPHVKVLLFDDLRTDAASTYRELLEFLGVHPQFEPDFSVVNASRQARSLRLQRLLYSPKVQKVLGLLPGFAHHVVWRSLVRVNVRRRPRPPIDAAVEDQLRRDLTEAIGRLEELLGRDLSSWKERRPEPA